MTQPPVSVEGDMEIRPASTSGDGWVVTLDEAGEVVAAVPATGADDEVARRDIVVVDAACPVVAALNSPAFDEARWPVTVVVRAGDAIVGVWDDADLADTWPHRLYRGSADVAVPGDVRIAVLRRLCGFQGTTRCGARRDFVFRPTTAVPCANPDGLAAHDFVW